MKIRLHPEDCKRFGVDEVIDFDPTRIGLRAAAALQKASGIGPETLGTMLQSEQPDVEALAALIWLAIGKATGVHPDWTTFDVCLLSLDDDEEPGKAPRTAKTSTSKSAGGRRRSPTT